MKEPLLETPKDSTLSLKETLELQRLKKKFSLFHSNVLKEIQFKHFSEIPVVKKPKPKCYKCISPLSQRSCKLCVFSNLTYSSKNRNYKGTICGICDAAGHYSDSCILSDCPDRDFSLTTCLNCRAKGHANCFGG